MIAPFRSGPAVFNVLSDRTDDCPKSILRDANARCNAPNEEGDPTQVPARFAALRLQLLRGGQHDQAEHWSLAISLASQAVETILGIRPYYVQKQAAEVMARGGVAEMATGEGKTLSVALAASALAASARVVHIATANDYLASRDFHLFRGFYNYLGLTVGLCQAQQTDVQRHAAYANNIVYGTADHFAFDHLRTVLQRSAGLRMPLGERIGGVSRTLSGASQAHGQRHDAVIVDEIDHVLIDEADTPLVLSIPQKDARAVPASVYAAAQGAARDLDPERDWLLDQHRARVTLTDRGRAAVLNRQPAASLARPWFEYVQRAIEATVVLQRDIDYVVRNEKVELIDPATGRISMGRQWQDGLYQAVEQEEELTPTAEYAAAAQITRWRFFQLYRMVAGCSGTAWDCRQELRRLYRLETVAIPLRCPSALRMEPPHFSATRQEKCDAVIAEVQRIHPTGRPVLIGTPTIQDSNEIAERLQRLDFRFRLLNGSQSEDEAHVIAQAGGRSAITVATDLAGRGTDIELSDETVGLGGLHVILAEPRHSRRLDRQLIGRAARQGQPGSARVFVSAEDKLVAQYAPGLARILSKKAARSSGHNVLWRAVVRAAERSETRRAVVRRLIANRDRQHDHFFSVIDLPNR